MNITQNDKLQISRKELYFAALFHDIGKYIQRGVLKNFKDLNITYKDLKKYSDNRAHETYSAAFIDKFIDSDKYNIFNNVDKNNILKLVLNHHNTRDKNISEKYRIKFNDDLSNELILLILSDWLSSSERQSDDTQFNKPLKSIFSDISIDKNNTKDEKYYYIKRMDVNDNSIFPEVNRRKSSFKYEDDKTLYFYAFYKKQFNYLFSDYTGITKKQQIATLMERYFTTAPSAYYKSVPDISLYDHTKTTAAISICLYEQYNASQLCFRDNDVKRKSFNSEANALIKNKIDKQFIFINGDLSGIQEFIYDIKDKIDESNVKNSAKKVKFRSSYISLLMDIIANYILQVLNLEQENLLFCSGGNFYILAPFCKRDKVEELIECIAKKLLRIHKGELYCAIDYLELTFDDFMKFNEQWDKLSNKTQKKKYKKWLSDGDLNIYNYFFNENSQEINKNNIINSICDDADSLNNIVKKLDKSNYMLYKYSKDEINKKDDNNQLNSIFNEFNTNIIFKKDVSEDEYSDTNTLIYKLNDFDILNKTKTLIEADKFIFRTYELPKKTDKDNDIVSFDDLAKMGKKSLNEDEILGDDKLAYVKLDVDNLGQLFREGFKPIIEDDMSIDNKTISRVTTLSRMINIFFEFYIDHLVKKENLHNKIYILYSGGDDTFIIGAWNIVLDFINLINDEFRRYTCYNTDITISAAVKIYNPKYPIARVMPLLNDEMDYVKNYKLVNEEKPTKNKVVIMGEVITWIDLKVVLELKNYFADLVVRKIINKSTLQKLSLVNEEIAKGTKKIWKLYYYLRNIKIKFEADKIINIYEEILFNQRYLMKNTNDQKENWITITNTKVLDLAVELAEMTTRKKDRGC